MAIKKVLAGIAVLLVFIIVGFSQQAEKKNPQTIGQAVVGQLDLDVPLNQMLAAPATVGYTGDFSVGAGSSSEKHNCGGHFLGYVHSGDTVDVWAHGLSGFDPVLVIVKVNPMDASVSGFKNDDAAQDNKDAHLTIRFTNEGAVFACVRGYAWMSGQYKLEINMQ
jgi:hypothetical protein